MKPVPSIAMKPRVPHHRILSRPKAWFGSAETSWTKRGFMPAPPPARGGAAARRGGAAGGPSASNSRAARGAPLRQKPAVQRDGERDAAPDDGQGGEDRADEQDRGRDRGEERPDR